MNIYPQQFIYLNNIIMPNLDKTWPNGKWSETWQKKWTCGKWLEKKEEEPTKNTCFWGWEWFSGWKWGMWKGRRQWGGNFWGGGKGQWRRQWAGRGR